MNPFKRRPTDSLEWQVQTLQGALEALDAAIVDLEARRSASIGVDPEAFLTTTSELSAKQAERPALMTRLEEAQRLLAAQREAERKRCSTEELTRWRSSTWEPMLAAVSQERQQRILDVQVAGEKLQQAVEALEAHPAEVREAESQTRATLHELERQYGDLSPALLQVPLARPVEVDLSPAEREQAFGATRQWLKSLQPAPPLKLILWRDELT